MNMKKIEYYNLLKKLNENFKYIFDDVMHIKQLYPNTPICLFLTKGVRTSKKFTLKYNLRIITIIK